MNALYYFIPQISGNFPRNYSGKVPLFFRKNSAETHNPIQCYIHLTRYLPDLTIRTSLQAGARLRVRKVGTWRVKTISGNFDKLLKLSGCGTLDGEDDE